MKYVCRLDLEKLCQFANDGKLIVIASEEAFDKKVCGKIKDRADIIMKVCTDGPIKIYKDRGGLIRLSSERVMGCYPKRTFAGIDLGLPSGRIWANMNVGAYRCEEYGGLFSFDEANALEFEDGWHMPSRDDFKELDKNCDHEFITVNGVNGMRFVSRINGNSVYFPAAGDKYGTLLDDRGSCGKYWSSSWYSAKSAYSMCFGCSSVNPQNCSPRNFGFSVRAVK